MMVQVRIDVYLKLMGIFKTRSVAGKACKAGFIYIDDKAVKSSHSIQNGDLFEIVKPDGSRLTVEVLKIPPEKQVSRKDRPSAPEYLVQDPPVSSREGQQMGGAQSAGTNYLRNPNSLSTNL